MFEEECSRIKVNAQELRRLPNGALGVTRMHVKFFFIFFTYFLLSFGDDQLTLLLMGHYYLTNAQLTYYYWLLEWD